MAKHNPGETAAKALIMANEELLRENEILKNRVNGFEGTMREMIRDRERWTDEARANYTEMIKQRKRADDAEVKLSDAVQLIGGLSLDMFRMFREYAKSKKDGT